MPEKTDKPRGILDGVAKSFVGLPHSVILTTAEQGVQQQVRGNELVRDETAVIMAQGDRAQQAARRAFFEIQSMREATQRGVVVSEDIRHEVGVSNERLSRIGQTLETGFSGLSDGIDRLDATVRQVGGLPEAQRHIDELLRNGEVTESEVIILAIGGGLRREEASRLFQNIAPWKQDLIESGLIQRHDPEMEKTLTPQEKTFLAELRRRAGSGIKSFRSLEALARHRVLDDDLQFNLSKTVREVRAGMGGVVHGVNELASQGEKRINQAQVLEQLTRAGVLIQRDTLSESRGIRTGVDTLVNLGQLAQADRRGIRLATETTAESAMAIARGVAAQIHLAQRAEQRLDRIADATEGTYRNTGLLTVFAERANEIAEANYSANLETANNTAAMKVGIGALVTGTHELIGFAERAEYARAVMIQQLAGMTDLLGDIADGIDKGNYYQALTREAIADCNLTLIQGFSATIEIGRAQLATSMQANHLLTDLLTANTEHHGQLMGALDRMEAGMERRHLTENQARAQERYREGLGKYRKGKIDEAVDLFKASLKLWSNDHKVYFIRGVCYALKDRPAKAEADFQEALIWVDEKDNTEKARIKLNLARLYYSEAKVHSDADNTDLSEAKMLAAITTAKEATQDAPDLAEGPFALAHYLAAFKLYDDARIILMSIIPKNPTFILRMLYIPEFAPLLSSFKHTMQEQTTEASKESMSKASVAVIKDCIEIGDNVTALAGIRQLIQRSPIHLLRLKAWEIEELKPIRKNIIAILHEDIAAEDSKTPQECYAVTMLALHFRSGDAEISDFVIFDAFLKGTKSDLDVEAKNKIAMINKLKALSPTKFTELLTLNKLHTKGLTWLN